MAPHVHDVTLKPKNYTTPRDATARLIQNGTTAYEHSLCAQKAASEAAMPLWAELCRGKARSHSEPRWQGGLGF